MKPDVYPYSTEVPGGCTDAVTGVSMHRALIESLSKVRCQIQQRGTTLSLLIFDIDGFRVFNHAHSHAIGDQLLQWLGRSLLSLVGDAALVGRYQWDRFIVALPDTDEGRAFHKAERFRREHLRGPLRIDGVTLTSRVRIGIVASQPGFLETEQDLIERGLSALARAKELGGNQTACWSWLPQCGVSRRRLERASVAEMSSWVSRIQQQLKRSYAESAQALVAAVEAKDPHTRRHSLNVSYYCDQIARRMKLPPHRIETLRLAAMLHDIGKIAIPDTILQKPGPLDAEEFELVKRHPATALEILAPTSFLRAELPLILHHHERFDGAGYPDRLAGEDIPLGARILNVGDSLDAMLSTRSYKEKWPLDRALSELRSCAGSQFDADVAKVVCEWLESEPDAVMSAGTDTAEGQFTSLDSRLRTAGQMANNAATIPTET